MNRKIICENCGHIMHIGNKSKKIMNNNNISDIITQLISTKMKLIELYNLASKDNNPKTLSIVQHYSILELHTFIESLDSLELIITGNEKYQLSTIKPIIRWLKKYKNGIKKYRNTRVAHIDLNKLKFTTMDFINKYNLPMKITDIMTMYAVIEFITHVVTMIYLKKINEMSKKLPKFSNIKNDDVIDHGLCLYYARKETIENLKMLKGFLNDDQIDSCLAHLEMPGFTLITDDVVKEYWENIK
ncbi:MAG: hypothetical protein MPK62_01170 [Alphaproteobacteria bacterium]|nr:hypothetical protein [Alphaproteobacteria bacterium]MDA8029746.1 hypothetical protein [Alphaproteobacteria bacterium]